MKLLADEAAVGSVMLGFPDLDSEAFFLLGVFFLPLVAGLCGKGGRFLIRMGGAWLPGNVTKFQRAVCDGRFKCEVCKPTT